MRRLILSEDVEVILDEVRQIPTEVGMRNYKQTGDVVDWGALNRELRSSGRRVKDGPNILGFAADGSYEVHFSTEPIPAGIVGHDANGSPTTEMP